MSHRESTVCSMQRRCAALPLVSFLLVVLQLTGCVSGPVIRESSTDGEGAIIPGCANVSRSDNTREFLTEYYLTTWSSAFREGAAQGILEGLGHMGSDGTDPETIALAFDWLPESEIFCRVFDSQTSPVFAFVERMLPKYGYSWRYLNPQEGLLWTDYVYRSQAPILPNWLSCTGCSEPNPMAKWKDRYLIDIKPHKNGGSIVRIHRDIAISRRTRGDWSGYIRAISSGHNESAILSEIDRGL